MGGSYWLYGNHAVNAALANPQRIVRRLVASKSALEQLVLPKIDGRKLPQPEMMDGKTLDGLLGANAVHQSIGAYVEPLQAFVLEDIIHTAKPRGPLVVLDQVSDPHNVGAILRTAAAFDAVGVLMPKDHSAPETAVMAKAASGALDLVPRIVVTNLATAMRELKEAGWWITGLSGDAKQSLADIKFGDKTVLILGAEGSGMRRLTAELCDELARLPISPNMESLNVSNAAAIALYHCYTVRKHA
ncbi:MAG: 23S rRNA (guanosine(2251)-2'-O)-methyltransferase RlmB [Rhodospirillales bacterium 12-54-5]|nr:MAG: 23S rRNA (guanosine(2251)-2'-O)-methyltransferase RlmB [Rhodospirillales bacterium 12-54-5]